MTYQLSGKIRFVADNGAKFEFPIPHKKAIQVADSVLQAIQTGFQSQASKTPEWNSEDSQTGTGH